MVVEPRACDASRRTSRPSSSSPLARSLARLRRAQLAPRTEVRGRPVKSTADPYECGLPSEVQKGFRFGISFYLIAMLFILFDIEVVFLYPVAVQLRAFGTFALVETVVFIALLLVAFVYVWRRGALEWR